MVTRPLLRSIVLFYRCFSPPCQLPTREHKIVFYQIVLYCGTLYVLFGLDPYFIGQMSPSCHEKPLLATLIKFNRMYNHSAHFVINMAYMVIFGELILSLLESDCFARAYQTLSLATQKRTLYSVVGVNAASFALFFFGSYLHHLMKNASGVVDLARIVCITVVHVRFYCIVGIVVYAQCGNHLVLKTMRDNLTKRNQQTKKELDELLCQIGNLSKVNHQLNQLLSFPLLLFLCNNAFETIITMSFLFVGSHFVFGPVICVSLNCAIIVILVCLNQRVVLMFKEIYLQIRSVTVLTTQSESWLADQSGKISVQIRLASLDQYQNCLQMGLFNLISLDRSFLLKCALFILNYVILLIQTST